MCHQVKSDLCQHTHSGGNITLARKHTLNNMQHHHSHKCQRLWAKTCMDAQQQNITSLTLA